MRLRRKPRKTEKPCLDGGLTTALTECALALETVAGRTDELFNAAARSFQELVARSRHISGQSAELIEAFGGEVICRSMGTISRMLAAIEHEIAVQDGGLMEQAEFLKKYCADFEQIARELDQEGNMILELGLLGFMTRVENAHLKTCDAGFAGLAAEVKAMSGSIDVSFRQIVNASRQLAEDLRRRLPGIELLTAQRRKRADTVTARLVDSHAAMEARNAASGLMAGDLDRRAAALAGYVNDIVGAIQVGDITRQQVEHVVAALREHGQPDPVMVRDLSRLQTCQLRNSGTMLTQSRERISANTEGIRQTIAGLLEQVGSHGGGDSRNALLDSCRRHFEEARAIYHGARADRRQIDETLQGLWQAVAGMAGHVSAIEQVGFELQLIAINARIRAARIGEGGRALDVLSGAIYAMSRKARDRTIHLAGRLARMEAAAGTAGNDGAAGDDGITTGLEQVIADMLALEDHCAGVVSGIEEGARCFQTALEAVGRFAAGVDDLLAEIDRQALRLEALASAAEKLCPTGGAADLAVLARNYTMASERQIHQGVEEPAGPDALGDNVELF